MHYVFGILLSYLKDNVLYWEWASKRAFGENESHSTNRETSWRRCVAEMNVFPSESGTKHLTASSTHTVKKPGLIPN